MPSTIWVDQSALADRLRVFFGAEKANLTAFGSTVNQTFEAFVFAQVVGWYRARGWTVALVAPKGFPEGTVRLKFSTRGRPGGYTYARCQKGKRTVQVRHGLRVATRHHRSGQYPPANVCLDVSVIRDIDLSSLGTTDYLNNKQLLTFGEAKHMSAFAELIASFLGLVHEMMPERLQPRSAPRRKRLHLSPFLYVSGILYPTAQGILQTMTARRLDVMVHDHSSRAFLSAPLPTMTPLRPSSRKAATAGSRRSGRAHH